MADTYALATQLLQLTVTELEGLGLTLPPTQYVGPGGTVAYDGEQLTVNIGRWYGGQPGLPGQQDVQPALLHFHSVDFIVALLRLTPVQQEDGMPPSTANLEASAQQNMKDGDSMRKALENIHRAYSWVDRGVPVSIGPVVNYGPSGGLVGVYCTVSAQV